MIANFVRNVPGIIRRPYKYGDPFAHGIGAHCQFNGGIGKRTIEIRLRGDGPYLKALTCLEPLGNNAVLGVLICQISMVVKLQSE